MSEAHDLLGRANDAANAGEAGMARALLRQLVEEHPDSREAAVARTTLEATPNAQRVKVVDLDIEFGSMVALFVKAALAMIPAALILGAIGAVITMGLMAISQSM